MTSSTDHLVVVNSANSKYEIVAPTTAPPIAPTMSPCRHIPGGVDQSTIPCLRIQANNLAICDRGWHLRQLPQLNSAERWEHTRNEVRGCKFARFAHPPSLHELLGSSVRMEVVFMPNYREAQPLQQKWNVLLFYSTVVALGVLLGAVLSH